MPTSDKLRILIVDDHDIVRKGLAMLVSRQDDFSVVGEAGTVSEALKKARASAPDVVVMDIGLPDGSGIEACRDIRDDNPDIKVLILTSLSDEEAVVSSIIAGASGYLLKKAHSQEIVDAIRKLDTGQPLIDPTVTASVFERARRNNERDTLTPLTDQEKGILELIAAGRTNREISIETGLNNQTVKDHVSRILGKLEIPRQ